MGPFELLQALRWSLSATVTQVWAFQLVHRNAGLCPPIPLPGQKRPAWPTRSVNVILRKSLEVSGATKVEFIGLKRVATRLLPKSHGPRFRHRRHAVRGSLRQNVDASPSKQPEGSLGECDQAMCASGASRGASWGWPYKAQDKKNKIDANRSAVFCYGFKKKKQKQCH